MRTEATTVADYLAELDEDRRAQIEPVYRVVRDAMPAGYAENRMALYSDSAEAADFRARWTADGRKLDMGKSCLRFRTPADLRLDLVAETVAATSPDDFVARYEHARSGRR